MMRCDCCKYWTEADEWEAKGAGFGRCIGARHGASIEDDVVIKKGEDVAAFKARRRAALVAERCYVRDASDYVAKLFTAPDFFCAKFTDDRPDESS